MRILISSPPHERPRLYVVRNDDLLVMVHAADERTTRGQINLFRAIWPGLLLGANYAPLDLDILYYCPRGRAGTIYVGKTGRTTLRQLFMGPRAHKIEDLPNAPDADHCEIVTLQPILQA